MFKTIYTFLLKFIIGFAILFGVVGSIALVAFVKENYGELVLLVFMAFGVILSSYLVGNFIISRRSNGKS